MNRAEDAIGVIWQRHKSRVGKVVYRDYDFKKPNFDLTVEAEGEHDKELELYDYPGLYNDPDEGKRLAQVRLEAFTAERATFEVQAGCPRIIAGKSLEIFDTPNGRDGEYFITNAIHEFDRAVYKVTATLIPKNVKYRSPRRTPVPIIDGPQTAVIVAPPGSPADEIHTDEHGRCKVKFHWDRYGKRDDSATFWMRVAQPQTSGSMVLPRIGWEVIVEFLEGNPDRPIVTGRVYNGKNMPPYALPEGKTRTALQTNVSPGGGATNEIRFEDKAGSEEIMINSHRNTTLNTANNKKKSVAVNETRSVEVDSTLTVGGNQDIKVTNGYLNTVDGSQSTDVGGNRTVAINAVYGLTVGGSSETSVGGNQMEMDGNPIQALLALALKKATEVAQAAAARELQKLDAAVTAKVNQVMGPINQLQGQVQAVSSGMEAVGNGDLGAAAGALGNAAGLPMPDVFGRSLGGSGAPAERAEASGSARAEGGEGAGSNEGGEGGEGEGSGGVLHGVGLDAMVRGAIQSGSNALGSAMGLGGGGGGGSSAANTGGPEGAVDGNSASDNTTGPGHAVNMCSSTHEEKIGSLKVTIAANGIHTTVAGARKQDIGAARIELVVGTRAENCLANKTENELGLVVLSKAPEQETVGGNRTTMVGGAILEKIGGSQKITAKGLLTLAGAFHKVEATTAIVFQCGSSSVTIDGSGVTIKSPLVTITAPKVMLKSSVAQGI
jgi:type VI secretion system secreted protein VgrG